jgi:predicted methyltransferase
MKTIIAHLTLALFLTACGQQSSEPAVETNAATEPDVSIYAAAVDNPLRPDADRERDSGRQPAAVLEFFGVEPGMTVLDLFSGGGYYAELLSSVVGESGLVVAHSNQAYLGFVGDEFQARHADNRLPNVEVMMAENNELELDAGRFDAIMMTLSFHDLYYAAPDRGWPKIDGEKLLAELYKGTKPGGLVGVIDHHADAGSPSETGNTLHRIDPAIVIAQLEAAGFVLEEESELLRNMNDDHSKIVFDPEIRGKSDRFVMRFRKPE